MEASYPSSTTLLVLSVMPTLKFQVDRRARHPSVRAATAALVAVFSVLMVLGRLMAGVHWATDIIGAVLLAAGLFMAYRAAVVLVDWIRAVFAACIGATVLCGFCELVASRIDGHWGKAALAVGVALSAASVAVFILARQPYAGITCFALFATKAVMLWMRDR